MTGKRPRRVAPKPTPKKRDEFLVSRMIKPLADDLSNKIANAVVREVKKAQLPESAVNDCISAVIQNLIKRLNFIDIKGKEDTATAAYRKGYTKGFNDGVNEAESCGDY